MVSKYNKTEVCKSAPLFFFDFVQEVLRLSIVYPIVILRKRKPFYFNTYNIVIF